MSSVTAKVEVKFTQTITIDGEDFDICKELVESGSYTSWKEGVQAQMELMHPSLDEEDMTITIVSEPQ
jgi:hypothetical protein